MIITRDGSVGVYPLWRYFWRLEAVSFYRCLCFYTLGLFSVMNHAITLHTSQPYGNLNIAYSSGSRAFTRMPAAVVSALVKLE